MSEEVQIERMSYGPCAITHLASGKTVFVEGGAPGDIAEIEIIEEKKSFSRARILSLKSPAECREKEYSPSDAACGTAPWQHLSYETQLQAKRENLVGLLTHNAGFSSEEAAQLITNTQASKRIWNYRNKLELGAENDTNARFEIGFYKEGSHNLIPVESSKLVHKAIEKAPHAIRGAIRYAQGNRDLGIYRVGLRHSLATGDLELALWTKPGAFPRQTFAKTLASSLKATSIVRILADPGKARKIKGIELLEGKGPWRERMGNFEFATQAPSFFQVNTAQAERLVRLVIAGLSGQETSALTGAELDSSAPTSEGLRPTEDGSSAPTSEGLRPAKTKTHEAASTNTSIPQQAQAAFSLNGAYIADLFAGGGTFSIPLAAAGADVVAVEAAGSSVRDLRANAARNHVEIDIVGGDATRELLELGELDALVVDPPRAGLGENTVSAIAGAKPYTLAYISCDPATWSRDVKLLAQHGYHLRKAIPVDMFPQTYHLETVSFFDRN